MTPWTVAHQAPLFMGFSREEDWSGLPFPSPGHLPHPGTEPRSPALQVDCFLSELPWEPHLHQGCYFITGIALTGYLGKRALQARKKVKVLAVRPDSLGPHEL